MNRKFVLVDGNALYISFFFVQLHDSNDNRVQCYCVRLNETEGLSLEQLENSSSKKLKKK